MNTITTALDQSDYEIYDDFLNIQIDGNWLDELLGKHCEKYIKGLIPTLLFYLEPNTDQSVVWNLILPKPHQKTICPILMCPDDCDFYCTLIMVEVEHTGTSIRWNRFGLDQTQNYPLVAIGSTVDWYSKQISFEFPLVSYQNMLTQFYKCIQNNSFS